MHYAWQSLLWKEVNEHKWKLVSLSAIGVAVQALNISQYPRAPRMGLEGWFLFFATPAALFIAMGTAAGERSGGTLEFLRALPIAPGKILAAKLLVGASTAILTIVPLAVLTIGWALAQSLLGDAGADTALMLDNALPRGGMVRAFTGAMVVCMVYLWTTAAGAGQTTELRAGLAGVAVFAGWPAFIALAIRVSTATTWESFMAHLTLVIFWFAPLGLVFFDAEPASPGWAVIACQLLAAIGLVMWMRFQFTRVSDAGNRSPQPKAPCGLPRAGTIAPAFRSRFHALTWNHGREILPSMLVGGVLVGSFVVIDFITIGGVERDWIFRALHANRTLQGIGVLLSIIVGVGTFTTGLNPSILSFWRSRPIAPSAWFWTKYLTGAFAMLLVIGGPSAAMLLVPGLSERVLAEGYGIIVWLLYSVMIYSAAVFAGCLLRHAVYAAIITFGFLWLPAAAWFSPNLIWFSPNYVSSVVDSGDQSALFGLYLVSVAGFTSAFTVAAWQAVRYDIGWKR